MRILIAAGFLGDYGETDGVVNTYNHLLPFFIESGHEVDVVAYGPADIRRDHGPVQIYVRKPRVPVRVDPSRWVDLNPITPPFLRKLSEKGYDLVQSSTPESMGVWARAVARSSRAPLILIYHTALDHYARIRISKKLGGLIGGACGNIVHWWMDRYYRSANLVLAPSEYMKTELTHRVDRPVEVFSRGVNSTTFSPAYRKRTDQKIRVLYTGRIAPEKGLDLFIELFRHRDDIELMMVGDGPYLEELREALPGAVFPGRLSGGELSRAYADADIFVFPSRTDTLGNVVLEAMSSGLPVIVSDAMGPRELVKHGQTGFVAANIEQFDNYLDWLIKDPAMRREMSQKARAFAELRSWDKIFQTLLEYYDLVCKRENVKKQVSKVLSQ